MIVVKGTVTGNYAVPVRVAVFKEDYTLIGVQLNVTTKFHSQLTQLIFPVPLLGI